MPPEQWQAQMMHGLAVAFLVPVAALQASVSPSFLAAAGGPFSGAPAVLGFTTSNEDYYRRFNVELRVVFLPDDLLQPTSSLGGPAETCHDLMAEVSEVFPTPLSCDSDGFNSTANDSLPFFRLRFGTLQTLQPNSAYRFVLPSLQFLRAGAGSEFRWRFEFWLVAGALMESVSTTLAAAVQPNLESMAGDPGTSLVEAFRVRGGRGLAPGERRTLRLSIRFNVSYPVPPPANQ
eukprot:s4411_g1.t2